MSSQPATAPRMGPWLETFSGVRFYPADPRPHEVRIEDVAHALARQCRFGGHVRAHYSVAQHSVLVSMHVPSEDALWALLHDAAEAYVVDLPSPIKVALDEYARATRTENFYRILEKRTQHAICRRFGLALEQPATVKGADLRMLFTERRDLRPATTHLWEDQADYAPYEERITPLPSAEAEGLFLQHFRSLWLAKTGSPWEEPRT